MKYQKELNLSVGLCRHSLATNGKSIGEGRATLQTTSKENRPEQNAFSDF